MLGLLEQHMTPTLDAALLSSSRAGADLGRTSVMKRALYLQATTAVFYPSLDDLVFLGKGWRV